MSPYAPQLRRARYERASDLGFTRIHPDARVLCLPQISSFVGGDIVAGIVTADLTEAKDNVLFIFYMVLWCFYREGHGWPTS